jgi:nucleoside-diphosphate-sugar epimerase
MRIVVTGASGFIGQHLIKALLEESHRVVALTSRPPVLAPLQTAGLNIDGRGFTAAPPLDLLAADTVVVHLASLRNRPGSRATEFRKINVDAAEALGRACRDASVSRFVNVSTAFLYAPSDFVAREAYLSSRRAGLEKLEAIDDLPLVTLLAPIIFGPDFPAARNRVTDHIRFVLRYGLAPLLGRGAAKRPLVFVDDVVRSIQKLMVGDLTGRVALAGEMVSQSELDRRIAAISGKRLSLIHLPERVVLHTARWIDILKRLDADAGYVRRLQTLALEWGIPEDEGVRLLQPHVALDHALAITIGSLTRSDDGIR